MQIIIRGPIIFLDFDGVLHPDRVQMVQNHGTRIAFAPGGNRVTLDNGATDVLLNHGTLFQSMSLLENCVKGIDGLAIVVTSSWRAGFNLDRICTELLPSLASKIIGVTPIVGNKQGDRLREIHLFLNQHGLSTNCWIAIDDNADLIPELASPPYRILCDPATGLTDEKVDELSRALIAAASLIGSNETSCSNELVL